MLWLMLFHLIVNACAASKSKYLYLGKKDCNAVGNEAYLDQPNNGNITVCSTSIPKVDKSATGGFDINDVALLTIVVMEADSYSGLENLDRYVNVLVEKSYTDDKNVTFDTSTSQKILSVRIGTFEVSDEININLNISSTCLKNPIIYCLSLHGTAHAYLTGISEDELHIIVNNDLVLDDYLLAYQKAIFFIGSGNVKIIDNNQILNNKFIILNGTNLEYAGSPDYQITQVNYLCKETVKRANEKDPKVNIKYVTMLLFQDSQITEFFDADVEQLNIQSYNNANKLTVNPSSTVYLPIHQVRDTVIESSNKIDFDEDRVIDTNARIQASCFSGKTKEGKELKIIYQNIFNSLVIGSLLSEDLTDIEFDPAFLKYQYKLIESSYNKVKIPPSYFEGLTMLSNVDLECADSTCHMDCLSGNGKGKLYDNNSVEIKPDYFNITINTPTSISFDPTKPDVTNFNYVPFVNPNLQIELKNFSGAEKTLYKFTYDIYAYSITLNENIDVQFNCNLHLSQHLTVPDKSSLNDSPESGVAVIYGVNSIQLEPITSTYSKKFNEIIVLDSDLYQQKHLIIKDLGSKSDEFNLITFAFPNEDTEDTTNVFQVDFYKITSCENVRVDFQCLVVNANENSIHIDKKTLDYNPKFTSFHTLTMGNSNSNNPDCFVYGRYEMDLKVDSFTNLYIDGNVKIKQSNLKDELKVSKTLFVKGMILTKDSSKVSVRNMIFHPIGDATLLPSITISNALFTASVENFSTIEKIKSPKLIISSIDPDQDITIQNQKLTLMKNNTPYQIDTSSHNKIILYLFHLDVETKGLLLAKGEGNKVNIKVEGSEDSHKVVDFNILPSDENKLNAPSKLKFVIHESISKGNPKFDGSFGFAFDQNLIGDVVYKEGENGNELKEMPSYFPANQVKAEPFVDVEPEPEPDDESSDESLSQTVESQEMQTTDLSDAETVEQPSEITSESTTDKKPDDHPSEKPSGKKKLSGGAIAGIVIGCVVAAVLIAFGFVVLGKKTCCRDV